MHPGQSNDLDFDGRLRRRKPVRFTVGMSPSRGSGWRERPWREEERCRGTRLRSSTGIGRRSSDEARVGSACRVDDDGAERQLIAEVCAVRVSGRAERPSHQVVLICGQGGQHCGDRTRYRGLEVPIISRAVDWHCICCVILVPVQFGRPYCGVPPALSPRHSWVAVRRYPKLSAAALFSARSRRFEKWSGGKVNCMLAETEQLLLFHEFCDYGPLSSLPPSATDALGPVLGLALIVIAWLPIVWLIWTLT